MRGLGLAGDAAGGGLGGFEDVDAVPGRGVGGREGLFEEEDPGEAVVLVPEVGGGDAAFVISDEGARGISRAWLDTTCFSLQPAPVLPRQICEAACIDTRLGTLTALYKHRRPRLA